MRLRCAPAQCKCESETAAIEELGHEQVFAGEIAEDEVNLLAAENRWDTADVSGAGGGEG